MQFLKKSAATLLCAAMIGTIASLPAAAAKIGDLNGDGLLTVSDVVALRQAILDGETAAALPAGDLNTDGFLTVSDVVALRAAILSGEDLGNIPEAASLYLTRGDALLSAIEQDFLSGRQLPLETLEGESTAFLWSYVTYVEAAAERFRAHLADKEAESAYRTALDRLERYRTARRPDAYAPSDGGNGDLYYDDNAWVTLALCDAYELLGEEAFLTRAAEVYGFCLSGKEATTGGIYWSEQESGYIPTCSVGPVALAAGRLYRLSGEESCLRQAKALYATAQRYLQGENKLYVNHYNLDGSSDANSRFPWTVNSGIMLCTAVELYELTGEAAYLSDASALAAAADAAFGEPTWNGYRFYSGEPWFHKWLLEGYLRLSPYDKGTEDYIRHAADAITCGVESAPDIYVNRSWDQNGTDRDKETSLIDQCGTASVLYLLNRAGAEESALHLCTDESCKSASALLRAVTADFYNNGAFRETKEADNPAYLWSHTAYLDALAAALERHPDDLAAREAYKTAMTRLTSYRTNYQGKTAYAAAYGGGGDLYFDDNALVIQAYCRAYALLRDPAYLDEARAVADFEYTFGWNETLGGMWWNTGSRDFSATCATGALAYASAMLYEQSGEALYLDWCKQLYAWAGENVLDADGLYINQVNMSGAADGSSRFKWTYNTGYFISVGAKLYAFTKDAAYLREAKISAAAADAYFGREAAGAYRFDTTEPWFHLCLLEGYENLAAAGGRCSGYISHIEQAVTTGRQNPKAGVYVNRSWDAAGTDRDNTTSLLDQCGTAAVLFRLGK